MNDLEKKLLGIIDNSTLYDELAVVFCEEWDLKEGKAYDLVKDYVKAKLRVHMALSYAKINGCIKKGPPWHIKKYERKNDWLY